MKCISAFCGVLLLIGFSEAAVKMLLLLRLRDRCVVLFRRRRDVQSTSKHRRSTCRDTAINACLLSTTFTSGILAIVALVYAVYSPHWIHLDHQSRACLEVQSLRNFELDSVQQTAENVGSWAGDGGVAVAGNTTTSVGSRCVTDMHTGPWSICAVYDAQLHSCGKLRCQMLTAISFCVQVSVMLEVCCVAAVQRRKLMYFCKPFGCCEWNYAPVAMQGLRKTCHHTCMIYAHLSHCPFI